MKKSILIKDNIVIVIAVFMALLLIVGSVFAMCFGLIRDTQSNVAYAADGDGNYVDAVDGSNYREYQLPFNVLGGSSSEIFYNTKVNFTADSTLYQDLQVLLCDPNHWSSTNITSATSTRTIYSQPLAVWYGYACRVLANNADFVIGNVTPLDFAPTTFYLVVRAIVNNTSGVESWTFDLRLVSAKMPSFYIFDTRSIDVLDRQTDLRFYFNKYMRGDFSSSNHKLSTGYNGFPLIFSGYAPGTSNRYFGSLSILSQVSSASDVPDDFNDGYASTFGYGMPSVFFSQCQNYISQLIAINTNKQVSDGDAALYQAGYNSGVGAMQDYIEEQERNIEKRGYDSGHTIGYNKGYSDGLSAGSTNDYSFLGLIGAVVDAPVNAFKSMFNFEVLGVNLTSFFMAMLTASAIIIIIRIALGGK